MNEQSGNSLDNYYNIFLTYFPFQGCIITNVLIYLDISIPLGS